MFSAKSRHAKNNILQNKPVGDWFARC